MKTTAVLKHVTGRFWIKAAIVAFAMAIRVYAAAGELTLDEIWSLSLLRSVSDPLQLFVLNEDNNHILNSLYLYLVPENAPFLYFRGAALAAGLGTLLIAGFMLPESGIPLLCLVAFNPRFVTADSTARGYALLCFCTLASYGLTRVRLEKPSALRTGLLQLVLCLGLLSHFSFVIVYAGIATWTILEHCRSKLSLRDLAALHSVPLVLGAALFLLLHGDLALRGGTPRSYLEVVTGLLASLVGIGNPGSCFYPGPVLSVTAAALVFVVLAQALRRTALDPKAGGVWAFYLTVGAVFPAILLAVLRPAIIAERYFTTTLLVQTLLLAGLLNQLLRGRRREKAISSLFLTLFLFGSGLILSTVVRYGTGGFQKLTAAIRPQCPALIGGDHDFRIPLLLDYYLGRGGASGCTYVKQENWATSPPDWLIIHRSGRRKPPHPAFRLPHGPLYSETNRWEAGDMCGFSFYLYRRKT